MGLPFLWSEQTELSILQVRKLPVLPAAFPAVPEGSLAVDMSSLCELPLLQEALCLLEAGSGLCLGRCNVLPVQAGSLGVV